MVICMDADHSLLISSQEHVKQLLLMHGRLREQVRMLYSMRLLAGHIEPTDNSGADLSKRVREISGVCAEISQELQTLQKKLDQLEAQTEKET